MQESLPFTISGEPQRLQLVGHLASDDSAQTGTLGMSRAAARRSVQPSVKATGPDQSFHNFFITHLQEKEKQNGLARSRAHDPTGEFCPPSESNWPTRYPACRAASRRFQKLTITVTMNRTPAEMRA